jgi:hypothetical protein
MGDAIVLAKARQVACSMNKPENEDAEGRRRGEKQSREGLLSSV